MADGTLHPDVDTETALYRHFDSDGKLLYVGISLSAVHRLGQHRDHSRWFRRIANVTIEWLPTRADALAAERAAIRDENPECNIQRPLTMEEVAQERIAKFAAIEKSRRDLLSRVVEFHPVYTLPEVALALGYARGSNKPKQFIADGKLGAFEEGGRTYVSGWQLIEYLESVRAAP